MYCSKCGAKLGEGSRFCMQCGAAQEINEPAYEATIYEEPVNEAPSDEAPVYEEPVYEAPVYEAPPQPVYEAPVYEEPVYEEPVYEAPVYEAPPQPVYEAPVYEAPPQPVYEAPVYEAPPPPEPVYTPPPYTAAPMYTPVASAQPQGTVPETPYYTPPPPPLPVQNAIYSPTPYPPQPGSAYQPAAPQKTKSGGGNLLKILIPVLAVVVILGVFAALEGFRVIDLLPSWPSAKVEKMPSGDGKDNIVISRPQPTISTPSTTHQDTPDPSNPIQNIQEMYGGGGDFNVDGLTEYTFVPNESNYWMFRTWNNGDSDAYLEIYDRNGAFMCSDDDNGGGGNSLLIVYLNRGEQYSVRADFYDTEGGTYTLSVSQAQNLSGNGDNVFIDKTTLFCMKPSESDEWTIGTYDNSRDADPMLKVFSPDGYLITDNDDGTDDYNALIFIDMYASEQYLIVAGYSGNYESGTYWLGVNVVEDATGDDNGDITASDSIDPEGSEVLVQAPAMLSFIPNETGYWVFRTSNCEVDPIFTLYDEYLNDIAYNDDITEDDYNAFIFAYLEEGETYFLGATSYEDEIGTYIINYHILPLWNLENDLGVYDVEELSGFILTPTVSGTYTVETMNGWEVDPYLVVIDSYGHILAADDDGAGEPDAIVQFEVTEQETYLIIAWFYNGAEGYYQIELTRN